MRIASLKKVSLIIVLALVLLAQVTSTSRTIEAQALPPNITISPNVPTDIVGAVNLENAAAFAWQEFIALNWPALPQSPPGQPNTRDFPDPTKKFGDVSSSLVWHTFRAKVEIYPGNGKPPNGYTTDAGTSFGYDSFPPLYYYNPTAVGTSDGQVKPLTKLDTAPFINLDENSEIGLNTMYAGLAPAHPDPDTGQQILFMAKANRVEYTYVVQNNWYSQVTRNNTATTPPIQQTIQYINQNGQSPPPNSTSYVSFPNGTIELKAAFRPLTTAEMNSGRFHTTYVRHYLTQNGSIVYSDNVWGLVALHIIQKTPSRSHFIYATFSQADNLVDVNGNPVEDVDGRLIGNQTATPLDPDITSRNATPADPQALSPATSPRVSGTRLYYQNLQAPLPQGVISLNKRKHNISDTIIKVNQAAHTAIAAYNQQNNVTGSPWPYYKLVSVQYEPYDKPAGITYTGAPGGPDPSTYYQANEVVESDYNLQVFSGQFQAPFNGLITDYNADGSVFKNVYHKGSGYLMGGCMGCHGNAQVGGSDFSFIFQGGPVQMPDVAGTAPATVAAGIARFKKTFLSK